LPGEKRGKRSVQKKSEDHLFIRKKKNSRPHKKRRKKEGRGRHFTEGKNKVFAKRQELRRKSL